MGRARRREWAALSLAAAASFCIPAPVAGQVPASPPAKRENPNRPAWGTKDRILTHVGFNEFIPVISEAKYSTLNLNFDVWGLYSTGGTVDEFVATAHVPSGALLTYLELDYCDVDASNDVKLYLDRCDYSGFPCTTLATLSSDSGSSGCSYVSADLTGQAVTMDNFTDELLLVSTVGPSAATTFVGAFVGYQLQLSPAPATATFGDVPTTHPYFRAIEALAASGITAGCGNGNFCPNQNVTRGEMAVFLARALGLHFPN